MDTQRQRRITSLLESLLELPEENRSAYLDEIASDDPSLRCAVGDLLQMEDRARVWMPDETVSCARLQEKIGPYRVVRELGAGGMGVVFLAERDDETYQQQVAVKLVRPGMVSAETRRRFYRERQILADLAHPNIARLLDGGTTADGAPYLVMEYVQGQNLDRYCDERRLSLKQRIGLIISICHGLEAAHRNLVVHRDLKPANVMVTEAGQPKLLDFGIAHLMNPPEGLVTATGSRLMSPRYAAPEQIQGFPITTSCDVYALGVLLHEQLTGVSPYDLETHSFAALEQAITKQPPPSPVEQFRRLKRRKPFQTGEIASRRATTPAAMLRSLQGDLSHIVVKALEKDPERRYASVQAMRADLERFCQGHPILARPQTWRYRGLRFFKRNRLPVSVAFLFVMLLIGFAVQAHLQRDRLALERDQAARERDKSQAVLNFVQDLLRQGDPGVAGVRDIGIKEVLARGFRLSQISMRDQPETRAAMLNTIGRTFISLGEFDQAEQLLQQIAPSSPSQGPLMAVEQFEAQLNLAALDYWRGHAQACIDRLVANAAFPEGTPLTTRARYYQTLARAYSESGLYDQALQTLAVSRHMANTLPAEVAVAAQMDNFSLMGLVHLNRGEYDLSEAALNQGLALGRKTWGEAHPKVSDQIYSLGLTALHRGDYARSEKLLTQAHQLDGAFWGADSYYVAKSLSSLGTVYLCQMRFDLAHSKFKAVAAIYERSLGENHASIGQVHLNLAQTSRYRREAEAALFHATKALTLNRDRLGARHPETLAALQVKAAILADKGCLGEAVALGHELVDVSRELEQDPFRLPGALVQLAIFYKKKAMPQIAHDLAGEASDLFQGFAPRHINSLNADKVAGETALQLKRPWVAAVHLDRAWNLAIELIGEKAPLTKEIKTMRTTAFERLDQD